MSKLVILQADFDADELIAELQFRNYKWHRDNHHEIAPERYAGLFGPNVQRLMEARYQLESACDAVRWSGPGVS